MVSVRRVLQSTGTLPQRAVGDPGEEERGSSSFCVLINECLGGDGEVPWVVQDVGVLACHSWGVDADVVLAEEDFIVFVIGQFGDGMVVVVRAQDES